MNNIFFNNLILLKPNKYLLPEIRTDKDIINYKSHLKRCVYSEKILYRLLDIILERATSHKRFQKKESIKILKSICKRIDNRDTLSIEVINKLFDLYSMLILTASEEMSWDLSILLKDTILNDNQLGWLARNSNNKFVLNRILRYPVRSVLLSEWGKKNIRKHPDRESEIIGIILTSDQAYSSNNNTAMIWGVYYSLLDDKEKKVLLKQYYKTDCMDSFSEVCLRLGYADLLEEKLLI